MSTSPLLEARKVKKFFSVGRNQSLRALDDVSFVVNKNDKFAIVGESGCGKSTLGKVILQLHDLSSGAIIHYGKSIEDIMPKYVDQEIDKLIDYQNKAKQFYQDSLKIDKKISELRLQQDEYDENGSESERKNFQKIEREIFELQFQSHEARKDSSRSLREGAKVVGSLIISEDLPEVQKIYKSMASETRKAHKVRVQIDKLEQQDPNNSKLPELRQQLQTYRNKRQELFDKAQSLKGKNIASINERTPFEHYQDRLDRHQIFGIDLSKLSKEEMRQQRVDMQMIFQDPSASLDPRLTIGQAIEEAFIIHTSYDKKTRKEKVLELLQQVGLKAELYDSYPRTLSGGQKQRVGIAKALALKPSFIVLDESVSALDVSVQAQILTLLNDLHENHQLTYFFITHDLGVVKHFCNRIMVMYLGMNVEYGDSSKIFDKPLHPYTQSLLASIPKLRAKEVSSDQEEIISGEVPSPLDVPKGCPFHTRCTHCFKPCLSIKPKLIEIEPGHEVACHLYNKEYQNEV